MKLTLFWIRAGMKLSVFSISKKEEQKEVPSFTVTDLERMIKNPLSAMLILQLRMPVCRISVPVLRCSTVTTDAGMRPVEVEELDELEDVEELDEVEELEDPLPSVPECVRWKWKSWTTWRCGRTRRSRRA